MYFPFVWETLYTYFLGDQLPPTLKRKDARKRNQVFRPQEKGARREGSSDSDSSSDDNLREPHASSNEMEFIFFDNSSDSDSDDESDDSDWLP